MGWRALCWQWFISRPIMIEEHCYCYIPSSKSKPSPDNHSGNTDAPLIDLSTDLSEVNNTGMGDRGGSQQGFLPSGIDIFDSLNSPASGNSQYRNLGAGVLPRPIFGDVDSDPDPFTVRTPIAAAIAAPLLQSLSLKNRTDRANKELQAAERRPETVASTTMATPYFGTRDDSHLPSGVGAQRRGPARSLSPPATSAMHGITLNDSSSSSSSFRSELFHSHSHAQTTGVPISLATRASGNMVEAPLNPFIDQSKTAVKPSDKKNDHAFDWLEEALRGKLSSPSKGLHKPMDEFYAMNTGKASASLKPTNLFASSQDKAPKEQNFRTSSKVNNAQIETTSHPMYDEVPNEETYSATSSGQNQASYVSQFPVSTQPLSYAAFANQYSNQNFTAAAGVNTSSDSSYGQYAFSSKYSEMTWGSEFDDDDFAEEFRDRCEDADFRDFNFEVSSTGNESNQGPPPIPPRTYHEEESRPRERPSHTHIMPMMQHGEQLSHTHYFCIPSVNTSSQYRNCGEGSQQAGKVTAAVRPYRMGSGNSAEDYQNTDEEQSFQASSHEASRNRWSGRASNSSSPNHHHQSQYLHRGSASRSSKSSDGHRNPQNQQGSVSRPQLDNPPTHLVSIVLDQVIGVTEDECKTALSLSRWDAPTAVQYLKVEQLFRLGISSRSTCRELLERLDWNLELAGSVLADRARSRGVVQCESAV